MNRWISFLLLLSLLLSFVPFTQVKANSIPDFCIQGSHASEAEYLICVPDNWNGVLIIYAHGYVAFTEPVGIPWDQLVFEDQTSIPETMTSLGFAFATTSYSENGLAIETGLEDIVDLVNVFETIFSEPNLVLLGGASEGGLITSLAVERYPQVFDGGLSACGPVGDFIGQINYWGDFRVIFDYYFPNILPPAPMDIPEEAITQWDSLYLPAILDVVEKNPFKTNQLLRITGAPYTPSDSSTILQTVERLLWYNVFATNDGIDKLGGVPYDNLDRVYRGIFNSWYLNRNVERISADQVALDEINDKYQTSGQLSVPLVTIHTTADEVVPYWHQRLYREKILENNSSSLYIHIPVFRYGHCNFEVYEVLAGFAALLLKVSGQEMDNVENVLMDKQSFDAYKEILRPLNIAP